MEYQANPLLIPLFATVYLVAVHALLKVAETQFKKKPTSSTDIGNELSS